MIAVSAAASGIPRVLDTDGVPAAAQWMFRIDATGRVGVFEATDALAAVEVGAGLRLGQADHVARTGGHLHSALLQTPRRRRSFRKAEAGEAPEGQGEDGAIHGVLAEIPKAVLIRSQELLVREGK